MKPEFKQEILDAAEQLTKQASEIPGPEKYLLSVTAEEMVKLAEAWTDTSDEVIAAEINLEMARNSDNPLVKSAGVLSSMVGTYGQKMGGDALESFSKTMGAGAAGVALGVGALAALKAAKGIGNVVDYGKYRSALNSSYQDSEILSNVPEERIRSIGDTVHRFAPMASQDPNLLRSVLDNYAIGGGNVDANTIKMLTEIEDRMNRRTQTNVNGIKL